MLTPLALLAGVVAPVCVLAQSATIFPVALGPEANLRGEIIGSGGEVGTTFVLSGQTLGVEFTLTLAQDASRVAERVAIPSRSYDLSVGCVISAGNAVCQNVVISAGATSTLPLTTLPYSPFAVPISTSGVLPSSTSASVSASSASGTIVSIPVPSFLTSVTTILLSTSGPASASTSTLAIVSSTPTTTTPASASSAITTPAVASSVITSQLTISASSTTPNPGASTATLASPITSQSATSDASRVKFSARGVALLVVMVGVSLNAA